jgi:hypothetical protein
MIAGARFRKLVAGLLALGLTNRQIALRLTIAERTVGTHLEHVFAKLGVQTRTQVALWVAGQEQTELSIGRAAVDGSHGRLRLVAR